MDILASRPNLLFTIAVRLHHPVSDNEHNVDDSGKLYSKLIKIVKKLHSITYYDKLVRAFTTCDVYLEDDENIPFWDGFYENGDVVWRVNHVKHRELGPAVLNGVNPNKVEWWLYGRRYNEDGSIYGPPKKKIERLAPWVNYYRTVM